MKKPMYQLVMILAIISCSSSPQDNIPNEVKEAFEERYINAKNVKWNIDVNGYYEADFDMDGEKYRADFEKNGKWVETENSIDYDDLPEAVKAIIEEDYDKDDITEIEAVDNSEKGQFFDVELKDKNKNEDIEITAEGKVIN